MAIEIISRIRRFVTGKAGMSPIIARSTGCESLAVAQVDCVYSEAVRSGRHFSIGNITGAVTGVAPVIAQATTAAQWAIWNNDATKSYIFDAIGAIKQATTVTATAGILVQCCIYQTPASTGANNGNLFVANSSNGGPSSKAMVKSAVTITTPAAPAWYTIARHDGVQVGVTLQPSIVCVNRDVGGRIIVPPGQGLGINVYTTVTASLTFSPYASWTELELDLE